jgi:hypothetical protein
MTDNLVFYTQIRLSSGAFDYLFKIGDFDHSRVDSLDRPLAPIPDSANFQDERLSVAKEYGYVDWYSLGCIMERFTGYVTGIPDPEFILLYQRLQMSTDSIGRVIVASAWNKLREMAAISDSSVIATILLRDVERPYIN